MRNAIYYPLTGSWLMPGSQSHTLHQAGDQKKLAAHEKRLAAEADARGDVPMHSPARNVLDA